MKQTSSMKVIERQKKGLNEKHKAFNKTEEILSLMFQTRMAAHATRKK
jgi:hypothetical protein